MPSCNTTPLIESRVKYWALIQTEANMDGWMDGWMDAHFGPWANPL